MNENEFILTALFQCPRMDLYTKKQALNEAQERRYGEIMRRRAQGEPLQYVLGEWEFYGLKLKIRQGVFIPRPETELLVDAVLKNTDKSSRLKILELGTGSGNIAVSLAGCLTMADITTVDIDENALMLAKENAEIHHVRDRIRFVHEDMRSFLNSRPTAEFDLIVANPPYVHSETIDQLSPEVRREPRVALDGGQDGLDFIRLIIEQGKNFLKFGGMMSLEIGDSQGQDVMRLLGEHPQYYAEVMIQDLAGKDRIICCQKKLSI